MVLMSRLFALWKFASVSPIEKFHSQLIRHKLAGSLTLLACLQQMIGVISFTNNVFDMLHRQIDLIDAFGTWKQFHLPFAFLFHCQQHISFFQQNEPQLVQVAV